MDEFEQNTSVEENENANMENTDIKAETYDSEAFDYMRYKKMRSFNRLPLILSLFGIMFSVIYGIGIIFGIASLITAIPRYMKKPSKPLKWAIVIGVVCVCICAVFIFSLIGTTLIAYVKSKRII